METKRIKEIKNTDAFDVFSWTGEDLKIYNLIYGWNGSGKTTISRLFNFLERKVIHIADLSTIEFSIQTDSGSIKQSNLSTNALNVRVFNEDFIAENLSFEQSQAKKIVILGKENVSVQKEIEALVVESDEKEKSIVVLQGQLARIPDLSQILTKAGSEVPQQFSNTPLASGGYYGRNYDKRKVEKHIESKVVGESNLDTLIISDQADIDAKRETIKSEKKQITLIASDIPDLSKNFVNANGLLNTSITIVEIEELKDDKSLREWVETGYKLHRDRKLNECKFCKSTLSDALLTHLGNFFTDELQNAKAQIESAITALNIEYAPEVLNLQASMLFPDLVREYDVSIREFVAQVKIISVTISSLVSQLKEKSGNLHDHTKKHTAIEYPSDAVTKANTSLKKAREIVTEHNRKVGTIEDEVRKAAQAIELHTIAKTLSDREYFKHKKEGEKLTAEIIKLMKVRSDIAGQINTKKASLQNATDAVEKINSILAEFFGSEYIRLEVNEVANNEIQYVLKRRDKYAKHLSEGEASVLALVYFLIKLEEDGCDKKNCLIVVDDPVDSQDSNFLFRTAGLLKRQLKEAGQLLVLTHNFEFFNLIRDWYLSKQMKDYSALFLISNNRTSTVQEVKVDNLPVLLKEYKSEYQYLFARLYRYSNDIEQLDEPFVANIARKVLEYFAGFKWACKTTESFAEIVNNRFIGDPSHLKKGIGDFVVKFLHEYSHGQDFSRPISASMLESKQIAKNVLEFIRLADDDHYDRLEKLAKGEE